MAVCIYFTAIDNIEQRVPNTYGMLAEQCQMSVRQLQRYTKPMIERGFLMVTTAGGGRGKETVLMPVNHDKNHVINHDTHDVESSKTTTKTMSSPPHTPPSVNVNDEERVNTPKPPRQKPPDYTGDFLTFWSEYPRGHGSKVKAFEQWQRVNPDPCLVGEIMSALDAWKQSDRWQRGYVKDAERFLSHRMWESVPAPPVVTTETNRSLADAEIDRLPNPPALDTFIAKKRREFYDINDPSAPFPPANLEVQFRDMKRSHYLNGGAR